jgi:hypothetical protein
VDNGRLIKDVKNLLGQIEIEGENFLPLFTTNSAKTYLLKTYIVTSNPKRISVAAGLVHMIFP